MEIKYRHKGHDMRAQVVEVKSMGAGGTTADIACYNASGHIEFGVPDAKMAKDAPDRLVDGNWWIE